MCETYIKDEVHFIAMLKKFIAYVIDKDKTNNVEYKGLISFTDPNGMLGKEENYKLRVAYTAQTEAHIDEWTENWIKTGKIVDYMIRAIKRCENLIDKHQITFFENKVRNDGYNAGKILYGIYKDHNECKAFDNAVEFFGKKYDLISFLYFMKVPERFLPVRSTIFDSAFDKLHIDFTMAYKCSWENYDTYL